LHSFKGDSKFSTWVYKITYNTCLDHLKKRKKEDSIVYVDDFNEHHIQAIEDIIGDIDEKERNQKVQDCLNLLSGDDAFLLTLYYFDDLSTEEISTIMGINANNIKIKLFRSRKKLASILRERLGPEVEYYE